MQVIRADKSGFCFGVQRAVDIALEETTNHKEMYSYGQLIHNDQVSSRLKDQGLIEVNSIESLYDKNVIVRSHGVGENFYSEAKEHDLSVIDCTCPFVKKVHRIVDQHYKNGKTIIIVGDKKHPEVIGINGWCENKAHIVNNLEDIKNLPQDKYCVVAQTTLKLSLWEEITDALKELYDVELYNTICLATSERQNAARKLAKTVDCMVVIGGYHSSNTRKLYEICRELCKNTLHIEKKDDLMLDKIKNCVIIGITAGASTPDWIIKEVFDYLNGLDS